MGLALNVVLTLFVVVVLCLAIAHSVINGRSETFLDIDLADLAGDEDCQKNTNPGMGTIYGWSKAEFC